MVITFAEAEAMSWGLNIVKHVGLPDIIIESNSQDVIDFVNNRKSSKTEIQWMISEVQNKMKDFNTIKVGHTSRSYYAISHSLAKLGLERCETIVWVGSCP